MSVRAEDGTSLVIEESAFADNSDLSEFVFDTKQMVKLLGEKVFQNCASLRYVQFRKGIKTVVGVSGFHCSSGSSCECGKGFQNALSKDSAYFSCTPCPLGTFSPSNSLRNTSCQPCGGGTFMSDSGASACEPCPLGRYLDSEGATTIAACENCGAGTYADTKGNAACSKCPSGKFSYATKAASIGTCLACPMGTYSHAGAAYCMGCPSGTFGAVTGVSSCSPCPLGHYSDIASATKCAPCPANTSPRQRAVPRLTSAYRVQGGSMPPLAPRLAKTAPRVRILQRMDRNVQSALRASRPVA